MFGVRIIVFACTLFGVAAALPLNPAEARPGHQDSYARTWQKSHIRHHGGTYAQHRGGKSYAYKPKGKSYAHKPTRKSYAHKSSQKDYSQVRVAASGSARIGPRPARWCGLWMRTQ